MNSISSNNKSQRNHAKEIEATTLAFLCHFFERNFNENSEEFAQEFVSDYKKKFSKTETLNKFETLFNSYKNFENIDYTIEEIDFDIFAENDGYALAEGNVAYKAVLSNNEFVEFDNQFKLFFYIEAGKWKIFFFKFPGFTW